MEIKKSAPRFLSAGPLHPNAVIIFICLILFFLRLWACRYIVPLYSGMDYYGYIELGRNIFHHLDFTVRWELDSPLRYPPFFSILIYLLSFLTQNFVTSIQYINIFSASIFLIPLFSMVKNILNLHFAILAVVLTSSYLGIQPCYLLNMDFFYIALIMSICWFIWDTLTCRSGQAGRYIFAGFLISVAYLTKYSGILFGYACIASILYYFVRHQHRLKTGLKMSAFLVLGAVPLLVTYYLLLNYNAHGSTPSISAYAFFDGNYTYRNGLAYREEKMSELNSEGTDFAHGAALKTNNEFKFFVKEPLFVIGKYWWGLDKITQHMTFSLLSGGNMVKSKFYELRPDGGLVYDALIGDSYSGILRDVSVSEVSVNPYVYLTPDAVRKAAGLHFDKVWNMLQRSLSIKRSINIIFQGVFIVLLIITGVSLKWPFNLMHVLFFFVGVTLIPFYLISERYVMPFMPLYFILWFFILNAGYGIVKNQIKDKVFLRNSALVIIISLVLMSLANTLKQLEVHCKYFRDETQRNETWLQTASWIKEDAKGLGRRTKIMSANNYVSYLTGSDFIRLPFVISSWKKVVNFAVLKKVNYIVIESDHAGSFLTFSEDEFIGPVTPQGLISAIVRKMPDLFNSTKGGMNKIGVPLTTDPVETLNRLLEYQDLYQSLPVWPLGSIQFIHRLKEAGQVTPLEVKQLNRLLIEANFLQESPHKLLVDLNTNTAFSRIKTVQRINVIDTTFWVVKL